MLVNKDHNYIVLQEHEGNSYENIHGWCTAQHVPNVSSPFPPSIENSQCIWRNLLRG